MSDNKMSSEDLYSQAYNLHYSVGKPDAALAVYNQIIELYPDSEDARSAKFQISQIKQQTPDITPVQDVDSSAYTGTEHSSATTGNQYSNYSAYQSKSTSDNSGNPWITGMKIFAWILFGAIIVAGIAMAVMSGSGGVGFMIVVGSAILAFLSVAVLMIFLNLAQDVSCMKKDISEMKNILQNNKK